MADVAAPPSFKKRTNKSSNLRKRPATPPPEDANNSASESDYTDDEAGVRVKRRKKDGVSIQSSGLTRPQDLSKSTKYSADRSTTFTVNDSATKTSNWTVSDAAAAAAQKPATTSAVVKDVAAENDGNYKGTSTYSSFIQKNPNARESLSTKQVGPVKAASNVRTITVTDFAPDVCKDYKQTGFCGFGDSCKFLHAREDYKQGWQLDKEWEKVGKEKKDKPQSDGKDDMDEEEKMLSTIPFKCIICKEDYKSPIVTRCGHYFCQKCAMGRYMKEKKKTCANCGADTNGTFNIARKLKDLLAKKKQREEEREQKETEEET